MERDDSGQRNCPACGSQMMQPKQTFPGAKSPPTFSCHGCGVTAFGCRRCALRRGIIQKTPITDVISQHVPRDDLGVLSCLFIPGQLITLGIGDSLAPAHNDIEKISRHARRHSAAIEGRQYKTVPTRAIWRA
jgi:hypothetical protein